MPMYRKKVATPAERRSRLDTGNLDDILREHPDVVVHTHSEEKITMQGGVLTMTRFSTQLPPQPDLAELSPTEDMSARTITLLQAKTRVIAADSPATENWQRLKAVVRCHGKTLSKRWSKKSVKQRKELLTTADPHLPRDRHPDHALAGEQARKRSRLTPAQEAVLLVPELNIQDFVEDPNHLLLWLQSRSIVAPHHFARRDRSSLWWAICKGFLRPRYLKGYVIEFSDDDDAQHVAVLRRISNQDDYTRAILHEGQLSIGDGLLVLQKQAVTFAFLVKCCELLLHDLLPLGLLPMADLKPIHAVVITRLDSGGMSTILRTTKERPYCKPSNLHLEELQQIVQARLSSSRDHILALREDPGYFAESASETYQHYGYEIIEELFHGRLAELQVEQVDRAMIYGTYIWKLLELSFRSYWLCFDRWIMADATSEAQEHQEKELMGAISDFMHFVVDHQSEFYNDVLRGLHNGPNTRQFFSDAALADLKNGDIEWRPIRTDAGLKSKDPHVKRLWGCIMKNIPAPTGFHTGLAGMLEGLAEILAVDTKGSHPLVSPWMADRLSELGFLAFCADEFIHYPPWLDSEEYRKASLESHDDSTSDRQPGFRVSTLPKDIAYWFDDDTPVNGRFDYPIHKPHGRNVVETLQCAEYELELFWQSLLPSLIEASALPPGIEALLCEANSQQTPPFEGHDCGHSNTVELTAEQLTDLHIGLERKTEATISHEQKVQKEREKIRGIAVPSQPTADSSEMTSTELNEPKQVFKVDKRALKTLRTLFFVPSSPTQPGEVSWNDFLHAITSLNFGAEKVYGSVWQFTPPVKDGKCEKGIQFYEPHPTPKLAFRKARRFGRRLSRLYGWDAESFVLE